MDYGVQTGTCLWRNWYLRGYSRLKGHESLVASTLIYGVVVTTLLVTIFDVAIWEFSGGDAHITTGVVGTRAECHNRRFKEFGLYLIFCNLGG